MTWPGYKYSTNWQKTRVLCYLRQVLVILWLIFLYTFILMFFLVEAGRMIFNFFLVFFYS